MNIDFIWWYDDELSPTHQIPTFGPIRKTTRLKDRANIRQQEEKSKYATKINQ